MAKRTHTFRINLAGDEDTQKISAQEAIKLHCIECFGFAGGAQVCSSPLCALYPYSPYGSGNTKGVRRLIYGRRSRKNREENAQGDSEINAAKLPNNALSQRKKKKT